MHAALTRRGDTIDGIADEHLVRVGEQELVLSQIAGEEATVTTTTGFFVEVDRRDIQRLRFGRGVAGRIVEGALSSVTIEEVEPAWPDRFRFVGSAVTLQGPLQAFDGR